MQCWKTFTKSQAIAVLLLVSNWTSNNEIKFKYCKIRLPEIGAIRCKLNTCWLKHWEEYWRMY